jgi:hypothetical protein
MRQWTLTAAALSYEVPVLWIPVLLCLVAIATHEGSPAEHEG